jgi:hypothetical protein
MWLAEDGKCGGNVLANANPVWIDNPSTCSCCLEHGLWWRFKLNWAGRIERDGREESRDD